MHSTNAEALTVDRLKAIYRADVEFDDPANGGSSRGHGSQAYASVWRPLSPSVQNFDAKVSEDIKVSVEGAKATTTFNFRAEGARKDSRPLTGHARVRLTWQRDDGVWQIIREELTRLTADAADVATAD